MIYDFICFIDEYKWIFTTLIGIWVFYLKEKLRKRSTRYEKTLEYYNDYSCQMFACIDAVCDLNKKQLREKTVVKDKKGDKEITKRYYNDWYYDLLCASGRATLVADEKTKQKISNLTISIINKSGGNDKGSCHSEVESVLASMNEHLKYLEAGFFMRCCKWIKKKLCCCNVN